MFILRRVTKYIPGLMHKALLLCFLLFLCFVLDAQDSESELNIDELRRRIMDEAPNELMSQKLGDSEVSLFLTGSWKGDLQGNLGFFTSPIGSGFISPETPILFKQEVDLTMALWINERWFVEVNFLDDSSQNTYRAGYQGFEGEFLQYAGVGNTGLDFPLFPYLDLGGDSPSSFGFYSRFGTRSLNFHTLLRYDAAFREERIFSGSREKTFSELMPQNSIRGISYVLPDINISSDIIVYIEDERGSIQDANRRKWRIALPSEYSASRLNGLLELNIRPSGMVAVSYANLGISMGDYNGSPGEYLYEVQMWLDVSGNINLANLPQCGQGSSRPGFIMIDGISALVIYEPGTFSPFERRNRYDAPSSTTERASLIQISSGTEIRGFELVEHDNSAMMDISLGANNSQRSVFELVQTASSDRRRRHPESLWPLAQRNGEIFLPEIYIPPASVYNNDVILRFTNYNSASGYFIGTDVIPGSVQVWRSGIQDSNFNYNNSSGEVTINGPIGQNEVIRLTYLKNSDGTQFGSIAAGVGAVYNNSNQFSARSAVGIRWNLSDDAFTDESQTNTGTVGISAKAQWDYDFLKAHIAGGFTFVQTDTTGLYRAAGMEGNELILTLPPDLSFISNQLVLESNENLRLENRADLVFRNYYNNSVLGSNLMPIEWNAPVVSGINRPYPSKDSMFGDVPVLVAEFSLDENENWTGFQIPLGAGAGFLTQASEIEIPFRLHGVNHSGNIKVIMQIGSLSGKEFSFIENPALIWENQLYPKLTGTYDTNPYIARFILNEDDKLKLGDAKYLRIIIYNESTNDVSGRFIIAPPIIRGASFRAITEKNNNINSNTNLVRTAEVIETGYTLESNYKEIMNRLHPNKNLQRVLKINWDRIDEAGVSIGIDGRIAELPLSDYRELSFFVKGPIPDDLNETISGHLRFIICAGPESINNPEMEVRIPLSAFSYNEWRKVTIKYQGSDRIFIVDKTNVTGFVHYRPSRQSMDSYGKTSYIAILLEPEGSELPAGSMYIDEIILENAVSVYRMNAGSSVNYTRPGTLVSLGNVSLLSDFSVSTAVESETLIKKDIDYNNVMGSMVNRSGIGFTLLNTDITGNISFLASQDTFLWDAEHSIFRAFGSFSVKESFFASPKTNSARHTINMAFLSDFSAKFDADAAYDFSRLRQQWNLGAGYRPKNNLIPEVSANTDIMWTKQGFLINEDENYGDLWLETFSPLVPDIGKNADTRRTLSQFIINQRTRPVGAVLTLQGITNFTSANSMTRSESAAFLDIPVVINRTNINFRAGRGFKKHLFIYGEDILDDKKMFFESINDFLPFWEIFPVYSLFTDNLGKVMDKSLNNSPYSDISQYTAFNDHFSTRINFQNIYDLRAFFIPSRIMFRIERVMEQKMDTRTDTLNLGSGLNFSAINMFGVMGHLPVFSFYQSDEYSHGIDGNIIIPREEDISWRLQSVLNAGFRGFSGGMLNFTNTFTIRSGGYWAESFALAWETPTKNSYLSVFYNWMTSSVDKRGSWINLSSLLNSNYEQLRRESIEITFDKLSDYMLWRITFGHEDIVRIMGRLNLTAYIKLRFTENLQTEIFTFDAIVGTSLRISF